MGCEKAEREAMNHLPLQKVRERDKGRRALQVLKKQSYLLETKLAMVRK